MFVVLLVCWGNLLESGLGISFGSRESWKKISSDFCKEMRYHLFQLKLEKKTPFNNPTIENIYKLCQDYLESKKEQHFRNYHQNYLESNKKGTTFWKLECGHSNLSHWISIQWIRQHSSKAIPKVRVRFWRLHWYLRRWVIYISFKNLERMPRILIQ